MKDVRSDPEALEELLELGARATPVTRLGEELVFGFDRDRLSKLLEGR